MRTLFICSFLLAACTMRAQYNGPESVEYDPVGDRYFVSNTTGRSIKQRAQDGTVTDFVTNIAQAPYGIELQHDTLFACVGGGLKGYSTADGSQVFDLGLSGGFLNGLASDGRFLYATDFNGGRILRVDPAAPAFVVWVDDTEGTPNGIVYDPVGDRLVVAFWNANAAVKTYDRATATPGESMNTGVTSIDGITIDCSGAFLIASWTPDQISRITAFDEPITALITADLNNPADIDYDPVHDLVCVPNSGSGTVVLLEVACLTGVATPDRRAFSIAPSVTQGPVQVRPAPAQGTAYRLCDASGREVAHGLVDANGSVDIGTQQDGMYLLQLPTLGVTARVVKH